MNRRAPNTPTEDEIRVLLVDDHTIIRKGMKAVLELIPDIHIVGEAGNGLEAVKLAEELHPNIILMDLVMPEMDGIEAIRRIKALQPDVRILVLTTFAGEEMIFPAIKAGALGYQLKDSSPEALVEAIRQVCRGEPSLHPIIARKVLQDLVTPSEKPPTADPLTQREVEVLRLIAQGYENKEIAEKLVISDATTRTHVSNILSKLHLASRTQAALYALREGLASLDHSGEAP
jgi:NarL family two-component system response regulator LiaR